jgi:hypothetical protein
LSIIGVRRLVIFHSFRPRSSDLANVPGPERDAVRTINDNIVHLELLVGEFRDCLDLAIEAIRRSEPEARPTPTAEYHRMMDWVRIACRGGALAAYSFSMLLTTINRAKAPTVWSLADMAARDEANRLFDEQFPTIHGIRQAAAHPTELRKTAGERGAHAIRDPETG